MGIKLFKRIDSNFKKIQHNPKYPAEQNEIQSGNRRRDKWTHLFPRFEPKKGFLKKARPKIAFG